MNSAGATLKTSSKSWWLLSLLLFILFFPSVRIAGKIPLRPDDLMVFGSGAILLARYLFRFRLPAVDAICLWLVADASAILLSTVVAQMTMSAPIGAKEYLDVMRPIKYLIVYLIVRDMDFLSAFHTFKRVFSASAFYLLAIAVIELIVARTSFGGPAVEHLFTPFTFLPPQTAIQMMAVRPFATFDTPTDLGYIAVIGLFMVPLLSDKANRYGTACACFSMLLLTATRTFLFSLPLIMMMYASLAARSFQDRIRNLVLVGSLALVAGLVAVVLLPIMSPVAAKFTHSTVTAIASGNTSNQDSINDRLNNLELVVITLNRAPILGVATRSYLPPFVDSEIIVTFHRYGIVGFALWLIFFPLGLFTVRKLKNGDTRLLGFLGALLFATFLYGITQGALDNTRIGPLIFIALAIGARRAKDFAKQRNALTLATTSHHAVTS